MVSMMSYIFSVGERIYSKLEILRNKVGELYFVPFYLFLAREIYFFSFVDFKEELMT